MAGRYFTRVAWSLLVLLSLTATAQQVTIQTAGCGGCANFDFSLSYNGTGNSNSPFQAQIISSSQPDVLANTPYSAFGAVHDGSVGADDSVLPEVRDSFGSRMGDALRDNTFAAIHAAGNVASALLQGHGGSPGCAFHCAGALGKGDRMAKNAPWKDFGPQFKDKDLVIGIDPQLAANEAAGIAEGETQLGRFRDFVGGGHGKLVRELMARGQVSDVAEFAFQKMDQTVANGGKIHFYTAGYENGWSAAHGFPTSITEREVNYLMENWGTKFNLRNVIFYNRAGMPGAAPPWW